MMERFFDVIFSGLALLVLSPLLVPIVLILMFSGEGEIFFSKSVLVKMEKYLSYLNLQLCLKTAQILVPEQ